MFEDELLELSDELPMAAEGELRLDPLLERREANLFEPLDRRLGKRLVGEVGERRATPEPPRVTQKVGRELRLSALECPSGLLRLTLEAVEVELLVRETNDISR